MPSFLNEWQIGGEKIEQNLRFASDSDPNNYTKLIISLRISEYC